MLCSHCVLPENYPGIGFDSNGVCHFCKAYSKIEYRGAEALERELKTVSLKHGSRTCIVPVSGGKDSTYVLYYISKVIGLNAIAVNYDNGLVHPQATINLQQTMDRLGIELVTIHGTNQKKLMLGNLRSFLAKPSPAMVPLLCTGCRVGIIGSACKVARQRGANLIVIGWSPIEDTPFKAGFLAGDNGSVVTGLVKNLVRNPRYLVYGGAGIQAMDYLHSYSRVREWGKYLQALYPGIRPISFYDYVEYNPKQIQQEVTDKVGWSCPDPKNSWQFDCSIKLLQNYFYRTLVGFTAYNDYLSAEIREGYITREHALELLEVQRTSASTELESIRAFLSKVEAIDLYSHLEKITNVAVRGLDR